MIVSRYYRYELTGTTADGVTHTLGRGTLSASDPAEADAHLDARAADVTGYESVTYTFTETASPLLLGLSYQEVFGDMDGNLCATLDFDPAYPDVQARLWSHGDTTFLDYAPSRDAALACLAQQLGCCYQHDGAPPVAVALAPRATDEGIDWFPVCAHDIGHWWDGSDVPVAARPDFIYLG